ncbi:methyl-accepting chemotaxis protein [Gemmatimonadota bacterium]
MLKNIKIGSKLIGGFIIVASLIAVVGAIGINGINNVGTAADIIMDEEVPIADASMEMMIAVISGRDVMGEYLLSTDINELDGMEEEFQKTVEEFDFFATGILEGTDKDGFNIIATDNPKIVSLIEEADGYHEKFGEAAVELMKNHRQALEGGSGSISSAVAAAYAAMELVDEYSVKADETMDKVEEAAAGEMNAAMLNADAAQSLAIYLMIGFTVVSFVLAIFLGFLLSRSITVPVQKVAGIAEKISQGALNQEVDINQKDEIGQLADAFRQMLKSLKAMNTEVVTLTQAALDGKLDTRADAGQHNGDYGKMVGGINELLDAVVAPIQEAAAVLETAAGKDLTKKVEGSYKGQLAEFKDNINTTIGALGDALTQVSDAVEQVGSASGQISSGSQSLAEGANEQASSLEEISSSLEEMSSMTKQNADNANQAKALSGSARESADKGNGAMKRMSESIDKIKASSDQTAKIVKTIDEIAFQTNLLALNAAVEAARAGEAGKGFAVVAEEVRNLAQRSAEAAKNTADMIEESVKNAEGGVQITEEVAKALEEIADGSGKVNDLVAEISAAAQEQSQGIEQVNTAVAQMDKVTQQNASNSEESASAAEELNSQAEELQNMVGEFKLSSGRDRKSGSAAPRTASHHLNSEVPAVTKGPKNRVHAMVAHDNRATAAKVKDGNGNGGKNLKTEEVIPLDDVDFKDF